MGKANDKANWKNASKSYSRLRMIANGSNEVNTIRALGNSTVAVKKQIFNTKAILKIAEQFTQEGIWSAQRKINNFKKETRDKDPPKDILVNVFIKLKYGETYADLLEEIYGSNNKKYIQYRLKKARILNNIVQDCIVIMELEHLQNSNKVIYIEGSQPVLLPPKPRFVLADKQEPTALKKKNRELGIDTSNIIIGIIDVGGFDFAHSDFLKHTPTKTKTRFKAIWDQGGSFREAPTGYGNEFDYGSLITDKELNKAIAASKKISVPPYKLEPQSQEHPGSHATHVASIAAGNSGVCSRADIVGVLISLPEENVEESRLKTFTDSSRISDAVDFLLAYAEKAGKSISINISLGTNGHAHDGSSPVNRWIDARLSKEGRCLCVATGNAGQEKGVTEDDFGYIMGRIHTAGRITNRGLMTDLEWQVIGNGISDISENELEIWYKAQDRILVSVKPPGLPWIGPVHPQNFIENRQLQDNSFISIYNKIYHPANGDNHIAIYLSPNLNKDEIIGIRPGTWKIRLIGEEIRDGHFDAWIERDNVQQRSQQFWNFPSFFSEKTNVDNKSINSLACGHNVVAVGNYDSENDRINITSSQGPSRDKRYKPEIVAPGTNVVAACGFTGNGDEWVSKTGTSMASPYACGVAGILLSIQPELTSAQIAGIFKRTCIPVSGYDYEWRDDTGFGIIDLEACIKEAKSILNYDDITSK